MKQLKLINTAMLKTLGMPFEVWLTYSSMSPEAQQNIVVKAIKKLEPDYCEACECTPCDCGYGS